MGTQLFQTVGILIWTSEKKKPLTTVPSGHLNIEHLNNGLFILCYSDYPCFSDAWFLLHIGEDNSKQIFSYSDYHSNNRLYCNWTTFNHLNTRLIQNTDPHKIIFLYYQSTALLRVHLFINKKTENKVEVKRMTTNIENE